jgi:hypothetical protein
MASGQLFSLKELPTLYQFELNQSRARLLQKRSLIENEIDNQKRRRSEKYAGQAFA